MTENLVQLVSRATSHAAHLFPLIHDTAVLDTIVWDGPASEEEHQKGFLEPLPEGSRRLTVIETATDAPVGVLSIRRGEPRERGDLGFWIGIPHQGRGYGTAAVAGALQIAFTEMGMEKVEACVFVGNDASVRVLEKNGFKHEGLIRKGTLKRGRWIDEHLLGITREDWGARSLRAEGETVKAEYDLTSLRGRKNPHAARLKKQVTIRLGIDVIAYFKELAGETGIPYQNLINLYLRDCVVTGRRPTLAWHEPRA